MKKSKLQKIIASALIVASITSTGEISAKATTKEAKLYEDAYNATVKVLDIGKKYNITARHSNNNTSLKSNSIDSIYKAVADGGMQNAINYARECIENLPSNQWQARNTFSNLLDGYQQPSYDYLVNIIVELNNITNADEKEFKNPKNWDKNKQKDFCDILKQRQNRIEVARVLNKGVDTAYKNSYSSALDKSQQNIINMLNMLVAESKKSDSSSYIKFVQGVVKVFRNSISENSNIKNYVTTLQNNIDNISSIESQKEDLDALKKEISELKGNNNEKYLKDEINQLQNQITSLKNNNKQEVIYEVPDYIQDTLDKQENIIKDLQNKLNNKEGSNYNDYKKFEDWKQEEYRISAFNDDFLKLKNNKSNENAYNVLSILNYIIEFNKDGKFNSVVKKECNELFPVLIQYLKEENLKDITNTNDIENLNNIYDIAIKVYQNDNSKIKVLNECNKNYNKKIKDYEENKEKEKQKNKYEIEKRQKELLYQISNELNNLSDKNKFFGFREKLSDLYGNTSVNNMPDVNIKSPVYDELNKVFKQYIDKCNYLINKYKENKDGKNIELLNSISMPIAGFNFKFPKEKNDELFKVLNDFSQYCSKSENVSSNALNFIYRAKCYNIIDNKFFINKMDSWITKDILKRDGVSDDIQRYINDLIDSSEFYNKAKEFQAKYDKIKAEIKAEEEGRSLNTQVKDSTAPAINVNVDFTKDKNYSINALEKLLTKKNLKVQGESIKVYLAINELETSNNITKEQYNKVRNLEIKYKKIIKEIKNENS